MPHVEPPKRLSRPVDERYDHILGPEDAPITLVEYGSYACPHCRAANERIAELRDKFGDRMRYVFRHLPIAGSDLAIPAAELAERARTPEEFWDVHVELMTRSGQLNEDDLRVVAEKLKLDEQPPEVAEREARRARDRVRADMSSARASGVRVTPTFFINGRRYEGLWEDSAFEEAMLGSLGHRVRSVALDFARWAPSSGILLLLASAVAIILTNTAIGTQFLEFWHVPLGISFGGNRFEMPLLEWINDGLLSIFFLVVGLEIKREFSVGHLSNRRSAALPVAAAIGGMVVPAVFYRLVIPDGPLAHGWGVPMATDTAFAVALIIMMGSRVPVELRIFLTAAAIVDDIGAISVVALFYSDALDFSYLLAAAMTALALTALNRMGIYKVTPYFLLGILLWVFVHAAGLHATLAGVALAIFIPTRPPPNLHALRAQANAILLSEARQSGEVLRHGPSIATLRAMDAIHERLESPADRLLRIVSLRSSYIVLPVFALANAGVTVDMEVIRGDERLMSAIALGLLVGKPLGLWVASVCAVRLRLATKPEEYSWLQLLGAGSLAGIGFTMSLFIAGQAFPAPDDFAAAKIAVYAASIASATIGAGILWWAGVPEPEEESVDVPLPRPREMVA